MLNKPMAALILLLLSATPMLSQIVMVKEESANNKYRLSFVNNGYPYAIRDENGGQSLRFRTAAAGPHSASVLPQKDLFIALPRAANFPLRFTVTGQENLDNVRVVLDSDSLQEAGPAGQSFYRFNGYLWIGDNYCAHFTIHPYLYDERLHRVAAIKSFQIETDIPSAGSRTASVAAPRENEIIENAAAAANWTLPRHAEAQPGSDAWIDYSQEYLKIGTAKDAIYRLSYSDLKNAGVPVESVDPKTFKLYLRGAEVPIYVLGQNDNTFNGGDYIEFLGRRNYGDVRYREIAPYGSSYYEYLNRYSDTTIYWLSWNGSAGKRVDTLLAPAGAASDTTRYYDELIHQETNKYWDFALSGGDVRKNSPELYENETWNDGTMGVGKMSFSFPVTNLYPGKPARAFVKIGDYSSNVDSNAHHLALSINSTGTTYDDAYSNKYQGRVLKAVIQPGILAAGVNTVDINSYATANTINTIIRDWYELEYPRYLKTANDSLVFAYRSLPAPVLTVVKAAGIAAGSVSLYKFRIADSSITKITNYTRSLDTLSFTDTIAAGTSYFLIDANRTSKPVVFYKKKFTNLRNASNQADYIAITHPYFVPVAKNYLSFISSTYNVATKLVDVFDIYDEFNYGFLAPEPIRDFLRSANSLWQAPKPKYVFLIGKGTYDYYGNKTRYFGAPVVNNFVPSYGNPVSDTWFTIWDSTGALIPQMSIGRIPVNNIDEFQYYFAKHQKYVSKGYDEWNKRYIFFSGGNFTDPDQLAQAKAVNDVIINEYVSKPPIGGQSANFYKTASPISNFGPYSPSYINNAIEQGGVFISYIGHSGTQTWDNSITDVGQLSNVRDRNPLITDFGCSTGKFAEPDVVAFSELATNGTNGQAIGYIGNSSLGFTTTAYTFPQVFYKKLLVDTSASLGDTHRLAKLSYISQFGSSGVFGLFVETNTLIGDPIVKLPIPAKPNFSFTNSTLVLSPSRITEQTDSVRIDLTYHNLGRVTGDSVEIAVTDEYLPGAAFTRTIRRPMPLFADSLSVSIPVRSMPGEHAITFQLDPANRIDELSKTDNTLTSRIVVASSTTRSLTLSPTANQTNGQIVFLNPSARTSDLRLAVEKSQNSSFSPSQVYYVPYDTFYTKFTLDASDRGKRIWLRTKNEALSVEGLTYSYYYGNANNYYINDSASFARVAGTNTEIVSNAIVLDTTRIVFEAISAGNNDGRTAVISKDGQTFIPENTLRGHHVVLFDAATYQFSGYYRFDIYSGVNEVNRYKAFLDTLSSRWLVIFAITDDGGTNLDAQLKSEIRQFGSVDIDSVGFRYSWAMIGRRGAAPGTVPEKFTVPFAGRVQIDTTVNIPNARGMFATEPIGPVAAWKDAIIRSVQPAGSSVRASVIGIKANNAADTLKNISIADSLIDLSGINAQLYPSIRLSGELVRSPGQSSPSITSIAVDYDQLAELGTNYQSVRAFVLANGTLGTELQPGDSVLQGEKILLKYRVYNAGGASARKFGVSANAVWDNGNTEPISAAVIDSLAPQSYKELSGTYNTALGFGRRSLRVTVDPDTAVKELFKDNNIYAFPVYVKKDSSKPLLPNLYITDTGIYPRVTPVTDESDSVQFAVVYGNSGAFINDSVTIAIRQYYKDANMASWTIRRKYPSETDTILINVPILKRAGAYQLQVELDPVGLIVESSESDNIANYYFNVATTDFKILQPASFTSVAYAKMIFLNPTNTQPGAARIADLQIDSLPGFSTAKTVQVPMQEFTTTYDISTLPKSMRYYWRIKQEQSSRDWTTGTFYQGESPVYSIGQSDSIGWSGNAFVHAAFGAASGAHIEDTRTTVKALSAGFSDGRTGSVEVNGLNVLSPIFGTGHNVVVMDTSTYSVTARRRFDISNTAAESDSLTQFIAQIPSGAIVMDVVVDEGANNLLQPARDALKTIGSAQIDKLTRRDSWAIIGRKGAAPGTVPESYVPQFSGSASVETTFVRKEYSGTVTTKAFGPLSRLSSFAMTGTIPAGTSIQTKFIGLRYDNRADTVLLTSGTALSSSALQNSVNYMEGTIVFSLQASGTAAPAVTSWKLSALPAAELAISAQNASISRSQVMQGEPIVFNGTIHNVSSASADSVTVQLSVNENGLDRVLKEQRYPTIAGFDSAAFTYTYSSKGRSGSYAFTMTIDPADSLIEESKDNNTVSIPFVVSADTVRPQIQVMVDGEFVLDGDYVRQNPDIVIRYTDNNPSAITPADTSNFRIQLNNSNVYFTPGTTELLPSTTPGQAQLKWTPSLPGGENFIQISAVDVAGNVSDTTILFVNVSTEFTLRDIYNLPNPFAGTTTFTFNLLSPVNPDEVSIKVFTVAGRLIQELNAPCRIGFNRIFWDGRDKDGDEIANGVYFYKVIVRQGNQQTNGISKLVKMR